MRQGVEAEAVQEAAKASAPGKKFSRATRPPTAVWLGQKRIVRPLIKGQRDRLYKQHDTFGPTSAASAPAKSTKSDGVGSEDPLVG